MRFFVTGTPRSATGYASLLFNAMNVRCTHEVIGRPRVGLLDVLDWYEQNESGDSSWLAWPLLGMLPGPVPVLHITRDPWRVVDSLAHRNDILPEAAKRARIKEVLRQCVHHYCPDVLAYKSDIDRAAALAVKWDRLIESAVKRADCPYLRFRVEDVSAGKVSELLEVIDIYRDSYEIDRALEQVPHNVNAGRRIEYNLEIKHPLVLDALKKIDSDRAPVVDRAMSTDTPRSPDELEASMAPELCEELNLLASEYGYSRDGWGDTEKGVQANGTRQRSKT